MLCVCFVKVKTMKISSEMEGFSVKFCIAKNFLLHGMPPCSIFMMTLPSLSESTTTLLVLYRKKSTEYYGITSVIIKITENRPC